VEVVEIGAWRSRIIAMSNMVSHAPVTKTVARLVDELEAGGTTVATTGDHGDEVTTTGLKRRESKLVIVRGRPVREDRDRTASPSQRRPSLQLATSLRAKLAPSLARTIVGTDAAVGG
jgi:hypothetical protein